MCKGSSGVSARLCMRFLIWGAFDLKIERLVFMNIFEKDEGVLGKVEYSHLKRTKGEFFETAHSIRRQLGKQAYLLDKYLFDLLNAITETLAHDASSSGFESDIDLYHLCEEIINKNEKSKDHSFYPTEKSFIDEHPLSFQEMITSMNFYLAQLYDDFLEYIAPLFFDECKLIMRRQIDLVYSRDLYRQINTIIGGEEQMEKLNMLIRQRFMITTAMAKFAQSMTNSMLYALTYRDVETNKPIIQIILEDMV